MVMLKRTICTCESCGAKNVIDHALFENWFEYYDLRTRYIDKMEFFSNNSYSYPSWTYPAQCKKCGMRYQRPVAGVTRRRFGCNSCDNTISGIKLKTNPNQINLLPNKKSHKKVDNRQIDSAGVKIEIKKPILDEKVEATPENNYLDEENIATVFDESNLAETVLHNNMPVEESPKHPPDFWGAQRIKDPPIDTKNIKIDMISEENQSALDRYYVLLIDKSFSMTINDHHGGERGDR